MSAQLIFRMELFKYMRDKKYLIATAVLAIINVCTTVYLVYLIDHIQGFSDNETRFLGIFVLFSTLTVFANFAFMFLYPFHLMSMDYKNDVMAMLVASGVNRNRLFFSKIGATLLWSLAVTFVLVFIPGFIILLKASQSMGMMDMFNNLLKMIDMNHLNIFEMSLTFFNSYLNVLVLISTATILMKGRNLTILVYFALSMMQTVVIGLVELLPISLDFSQTSMSVFSNLLLMLMSIIMTLVSLSIMKRQNL